MIDLIPASFDDSYPPDEAPRALFLDNCIYTMGTDTITPFFDTITPPFDTITPPGRNRLIILKSIEWINQYLSTLRIEDGIHVCMC